jgi:hypothetical protein
MAEALDVSKRYYEQLKQKTNDQKQDEDKVNIGCVSLVQYLKSKLQADAEHDWNAFLEWIRDQAKLEMLSCDNEIDGDKTSKHNNSVGDNNKGGNQTNSEEEDSGKRDNKSSSSDDNEQYKDDRDKANKEDIKTKFWETDSDDDNE